jgi:plasmid stability protein
VAWNRTAADLRAKGLRYRDIVPRMAQLLVRHLDDDVKAKLQRRARRHGHSTEEEVREILRNAVREESAARAPLGSRLAARFAGAGLREDIPELRGQPPHPADFDS